MFLQKPQKFVIGISEHLVFILRKTPLGYFITWFLPEFQNIPGRSITATQFIVHTNLNLVTFGFTYFKHSALSREQYVAKSVEDGVHHLKQRSPAQCTLVQASLIRKHDRAIVAGSGQAVWPVAEHLYQKLRNLLGEFCRLLIF